MGREIKELGWGVEEAIRMMMSAGILKPDFLTIVPNPVMPGDVPTKESGSAR